MKIKIYRLQTVEIPLKREATKEEKDIIIGNVDNLSMFDLDYLIEFDNEEVIDEDYSCDVTRNIPPVEFINQ